MRATFALLLLSLSLFCAGLRFANRPAEAQFEIQVNPSDFRKYAMAVSLLKNFGETPDAPGVSLLGQRVLMNDLSVAGLFDVLDPKSFLEDPQTTGITEGSINFSQWFKVGAEGLVKGGFWITGDRLRLDLRLFDVAGQKELLQRNYEGSVKEARRLFHLFADEIVKFFTREDGVFTTKIVSVRAVGPGRKQIFICDFDGENGTVLVENGNINLLPAFARDGSGVYFTSYANNNPDLYKVPLSGGKMTPVSRYRGLNVGASSSPDGGRIALTLTKEGNSDIFVMNNDGTQLMRITSSWAIDASPSWSPDGARLAFVSDRPGTPQIYLTPLNGGDNPTRLTFQGDYNQSPAWSPKGDKIAFCGRDERYQYDLFLVDVETKEITRLTQDQGSNEDPAWSPDGRHLVFTSTREGNVSRLFIMNADGTNQRRVGSFEGAFSTPDWSPRMK